MADQFRRREQLHEIRSAIEALPGWLVTVGGLMSLLRLTHSLLADFDQRLTALENSNHPEVM